MRIRAYGYAMLAVAGLVPASALAGTAVSASISAPPGDVAAGSTVQINCRAEGSTSMGAPTAVVEIAVTVSAGSASPALLTTTSTGPCQVVTPPATTPPTGTCNIIVGSAAWATPAAAGALTATCTGKFQGAYGAPTVKAAQAPLTTVASSVLPPAISAVNGPAELVAGASGAFEAIASDPNTPANTLTYAWTATGGTVTPDAANPALVAWEAPATPGSYKLTVTVSNGAVTVSAEKTVNVVLATYQAALPLPLGNPRRLAANGTGGIFVVDGQRQTPTSGTISLATARGEARGFASIPEPAIAVTTGGGFLWATTTKGSLYKVDPVTGRIVGKVPLAAGAFARPAGIAFDPVNMKLWVADQNANRVRVITPDGATVSVLWQVGGVPLVKPIDVAVDPASGKAFVLVLSAVEPGATTPAGNLVHAFDLATQGYVGSYVTSGSAPGQITTGGGIAAGPAGLYLSDGYQSVLQVVTTAGAPVATVGKWGQGDGQLTNPMGVALMANGDIAVANTAHGTIERFGGGADLPTCAGDADCDLLPDSWEGDNGLNPSWAGDGLADLDNDGLNNAQELALGTNPSRADTDGDGFSDSDELASGFNPLDPIDHLAIVKPSAPATTPPGLVKLSAVASGPGTCMVGWTQVDAEDNELVPAGPPVALSGASTLNPSFIARTAGSYAFDAVATCGLTKSAPARATVVVENVAPIADAGSIIVASPGAPIRLDALASSDANGDALSFTWDQTLGAALVGTETGGSLIARPRGAGLYAFQVTVSDPGGATSTAEVPVLVAEGQTPTAIAAAIPADAETGATVSLDASPSLVPAGATFAWRQVAGPGTPIAGASQPVASFVPMAAGRYAFEVTAGNGHFRSPPARVEVFVTSGGALPTVSGAVPAIVAVGIPVSLEATTTPASAQVTWRQVSGPAAGLTGANGAVATAVPFAAGFHVFEASVKDGAVEGHPTRIAFEARAGGTAIPQARVATPPGDAWVGQLVFLDGRASTGAARFRWTQVAGPWVAFGMQGPVATLRPLAVGRYEFELVVDDGVTRSAPARVEVNVVSGEVK